MASDTWRILQLRLRNHLPRMLGVAVLSTAVAAGCWLAGWLGLPALERAFYDRALTTFTRSQGQSSGIAVVAIDQSSLDGVRDNPAYARDFGAYPWSLGLWSRVMEELAHQGAKAVLFDGVMDEPSTDASVETGFAQVLRDTRFPAERSHWVPNAVAVPDALPEGGDDRRFVLGLVGVLPERKGLHRALDLLAALRRDEPRFTLRIRGHRPDAVGWMADRPAAAAYYGEQLRRLREDPLLADAVRWAPDRAEGGPVRPFGPDTWTHLQPAAAAGKE